MNFRTLSAAGALALLAAAHGAALAADPARGEAIYARCAACHSLETNRTGPRHCGLFGRRAGTVPGFGYSPAMKKSGIVWNEKTLDRFLANPARMVPGTTMTYEGVPEPGERRDLIAWLRRASASKDLCK